MINQWIMPDRFVKINFQQQLCVALTRKVRVGSVCLNPARGGKHRPSRIHSSKLNRKKFSRRGKCCVLHMSCLGVKRKLWRCCSSGASPKSGQMWRRIRGWLSDQKPEKDRNPFFLALVEFYIIGQVSRRRVLETKATSPCRAVSSDMDKHTYL